MDKPKLVEVMTKCGVLMMDIQNNITILKLKNGCSVKLENPESKEKYNQMLNVCDCKLSELHYLQVAGGGKLFIRRN